MTVNTTASKIIYNGNGGSTVWPFTFPAVSANDLEVFYTDTVGNQVQLSPLAYTAVLNPTVGSNPTAAGGQIIYPLSGPAIALGTKLTIVRMLAETQDTSLTNQGTLWPPVIEEELDYIVMLIQQLSEQLGRQFAVPVSDPNPAELPTVAQRANLSAAFDASGNMIAVGFIPGTTPVSSVLLPFLLSSTLVDARAILGVQLADNVAAAQAATWPGIGVNFLYLAGYYAAGDLGAGLWKRYASPPATAGYFQSADGAYWLPVPLQGISPYQFGAKGDGSTNDYGAFSNLSALIQAQGGGLVSVPRGTFKINTSVILYGQWSFGSGSILKPNTAINITLQFLPQAGTYKIFDLSLGGLIILPGDCGEGVWAEWWGADGALTSVNTANDVSIQQAVDALQATTSGGVVRVGFGTFKMSSFVHITNLVTIRGSGRETEFSANAATWDGSSYLFLFKNGTSSQFNCRLEECGLVGNDIVTLLYLIRAESWNEKCGAVNVVFRKFYRTGVYIVHGYGGAAVNKLEGCEFFSSGVAATTIRCIEADLTDFVTGYLELQLDQVGLTTGDNVPSTSSVGLYLTGNVMAICNSVHVEFIYYGALVKNSARLIGAGFTGPGGATVTYLVAADADFDPTKGAINLTGVVQGAATNLFKDFASLMPAYVPLSGALIWPPYTGVSFGECRIASNASAYARGLLSFVSNPSTGTYNFAITPTTPGATFYYVEVHNQSNGTRIFRVNSQLAASFTVSSRDIADAAADCADFIVKLMPTPN